MVAALIVAINSGTYLERQVRGRIKGQARRERRLQRVPIGKRMLTFRDRISTTMASP